MRKESVDHHRQLMTVTNAHIGLNMSSLQSRTLH